MTIYWQSTKAPVHLFRREYESAELAKHVREFAFVDAAILQTELRVESLSAMAIEAYQRRLGVRKIGNPREKR